MMKKFSHYFPILLLALALGCSDDSGEATDGDLPVDPLQAFPNNFLLAGESANDLLANSTYDRVQIQIAFVDGFRPTQETVDNFEAFLREHTLKEDIEVIYTTLGSPGEESLTLEEIVDLELQHRTAYNDGSMLAVYIYFTDAPSADDNPRAGLYVLGAVYYNTSMVIFEPTLRSFSGSDISITDIETATLNHEFGHLFGLVNIGSPMVNAHEDVRSAGHCSIDGCLMQAELNIETTVAKTDNATVGELVPACALSADTVLDLLQKQEARGMSIVPILGEQCKLDLQNNGGR